MNLLDRLLRRDPEAVHAFREVAQEIDRSAERVVSVADRLIDDAARLRMLTGQLNALVDAVGKQEEKTA